MDLSKVEEILSKLMEILDIESGVSDEVVVPMVNEIYDSVVAKYRPLVRAVPHVVEKVSNDLLPVINALYKITVTVREDSEFQKIMTQGCKIRSQQRFEALKTYQEAGFKRNEAMSLLLQDIANSKAMTQAFSDKQSSK